MINLRTLPQGRGLDAPAMEKTGARGLARAGADGKSMGEKRRKRKPSRACGCTGRFIAVFGLV